VGYCKLAIENSINSKVAGASDVWAYDVANLSSRLKVAADLLDDIAAHSPAYRALHSLLLTGSISCSSIAALCPPTNSTSPLICSTPMFRQRRALDATGHCGTGVSQGRTIEPVIEASQTLNIATFGWWEIIDPSDNAIRSLCMFLASKQIHVCAVTGLAAAAVVE
jgi:hypothetical protein